jgi:hypothetical protein
MCLRCENCYKKSGSLMKACRGRSERTRLRRRRCCMLSERSMERNSARSYWRHRCRKVLYSVVEAPTDLANYQRWCALALSMPLRLPHRLTAPGLALGFKTTLLLIHSQRQLHSSFTALLLTRKFGHDDRLSITDAFSTELCQ